MVHQDAKTLETLCVLSVFGLFGEADGPLEDSEASVRADFFPDEYRGPGIEFFSIYQLGMRQTTKKCEFADILLYTNAQCFGWPARRSPEIFTAWPAMLRIYGGRGGVQEFPNTFFLAARK